MARSRRSSDCEVAIIGAGPYGLAVAAHLAAAGVEARAFGEPMSFWRGHMPKGMRLRSPRAATSIADPSGAFGLEAYARQHGFALGDPLPLETFVDYGLWFQTCVAPHLDCRTVSRLSAMPRGYLLVLADGSTIGARCVVMAAGLAKQQFAPAAFQGLPAEFVTHTVDHDDLSQFAGRRVAVVGRGQSATESAALLCEAGAEAQIVARGPIHWLGGADAVGLRGSILRWAGRALAAPSAVGPFPLNWVSEAPGLVHCLPQSARRRFNERSLRAAAAGWLRPRFHGVHETYDNAIERVTIEGERIVLHGGGSRADFDHVLLATGYAIDIAKPGILAPDLLHAVAQRNGSPILSRGLESSAPGLHFVGASAVASFGPLMRFIAGAGYAARGVTRAVLNKAPARARGGQARRRAAGGETRTAT